MRLNRLIGVGGVALVAATVLAGFGSGNLSISGNSVPTNFITENGRVYVPLSDVAQALKMTISKSGNSYSLSTPGGASQVQGLAGKIGETLNCGYATVKVVKMIVTDKYTYQFNTGSYTPNNANEQVVVLIMRVKNATSKEMTIGPHGSDNSALVDNDEHAYKSYSGPGPDYPSSNTVLPGSACDFALCFSVPKNETPTQLIYGPYFYQLNGKPKEFRIDLKP